MPAIDCKRRLGDNNAAVAARGFARRTGTRTPLSRLLLQRMTRIRGPRSAQVLAKEMPAEILKTRAVREVRASEELE